MSSLRSQLATVPLALLGTSARTHDLASWDQTIRGSVATSRRISFVQLRGGAGASTTSAYVAGILAKRRTGLVLGVDASGRATGLSNHAGAPSEPLITPASERRQHARTSQDAVDGLYVSASKLHTLRLGTPPGSVPMATDWLAQVAPIAWFFEAVCTDWGERPWQVDLADVAALSHTVCLVTRADRRFAEEALALVDALEHSQDRPRVVLALVDVGRSAGRAPFVVQSAARVTVVPIPYDRARAAATALPSAALSARTRMAYIKLAAAMMESDRARDAPRNMP